MEELVLKASSFLEFVLPNDGHPQGLAHSLKYLELKDLAYDAQYYQSVR